MIIQGTLKLTRLHYVLKKQQAMIGMNTIARWKNSSSQKTLELYVLMILNVTVKNLIFRAFNINYQEMDIMSRMEPLSMAGNVSKCRYSASLIFSLTPRLRS